jgi:O-acetyl-ADP-ribose deacetylase (regulator of RNase III)
MQANLELVQGDITKLAVDAIVNAANGSLKGGGGVDGAIHSAAGPELLAECTKIADELRKGTQPGSRAYYEVCPAGDAVITGAYNLPCKKVIHTVGPIWSGGKMAENEYLASCYKRSLQLADEAGLTSIAFPNISTGVYGYPKKEAAEVAVNAVKKYFTDKEGESSVKRVIFICFDDENYALYKTLLAGV